MSAVEVSERAETSPKAGRYGGACGKDAATCDVRVHQPIGIKRNDVYPCFDRWKHTDSQEEPDP